MKHEDFLGAAVLLAERGDKEAMAALLDMAAAEPAHEVIDEAAAKRVDDWVLKKSVSQFVEKFCQEGPNAGKPGPCPTDGEPAPGQTRQPAKPKDQPTAARTAGKAAMKTAKTIFKIVNAAPVFASKVVEEAGFSPNVAKAAMVAALLGDYATPFVPTGSAAVMLAASLRKPTATYHVTKDLVKTAMQKLGYGKKQPAAKHAEADPSKAFDGKEQDILTAGRFLESADNFETALQVLAVALEETGGDVPASVEIAEIVLAENADEFDEVSPFTVPMKRLDKLVPERRGIDQYGEGRATRIAATAAEVLTSFGESEVEAFCMEGENTGKPGPCPTPGGGSAADPSKPPHSFPDGAAISGGQVKQTFKPGINLVDVGGRGVVVKSRPDSVSAGRREKLASDMAAFAGVSVPKTEIIDVGGKPAAVQEFVAGTTAQKMGKSDLQSALQEINTNSDQIDAHTLFDYLIGNGDNHTGNFILDGAGGVHGIDKELAFEKGSSTAKFRPHPDSLLGAMVGNVDNAPLKPATVQAMAGKGLKMAEHARQIGDRRTMKLIQNRVNVLDKFISSGGRTYGDLRELSEAPQSGLGKFLKSFGL